jgi:hypothetical protein
VNFEPKVEPIFFHESDLPHRKSLKCDALWRWRGERCEVPLIGVTCVVNLAAEMARLAFGVTGAAAASFTNISHFRSHLSQVQCFQRFFCPYFMYPVTWCVMKPG